jgi:hypothetical protein
MQDRIVAALLGRLELISAMMTPIIGNSIQTHIGGAGKRCVCHR